jgi:hypothetical protein
MAQGAAPLNPARPPGELPFVTVGGPGSSFPVEQYGNDAGKAVNAAGAFLKSSKGGTVYISGGIGTTYRVTTQMVFYDTVNYVGDGITLQAAPTLLNPFTTDPVNAYFSGYISGMTLDGSNVPGTVVLSCISIQYCTFVDLLIRNANAPLSSVAPGTSPTLWKNPSATRPAYVQVYGGKVTGIEVNGVAVGGTAGVFYVPPSGGLSIAWAQAPTVNVSNGTGVLLTSDPAINPPALTNKRNNSTNAFLSCAVHSCSMGWVLSGALAGGQVTNNTWTQSSTQFCSVCAIAYVNNCDSNTWVETQLKLHTVGGVAVAFNLLTPGADAQVYYNRHLACSIDSSNSAFQIGVLLNANQAKPNFILMYQPNPELPIPVVVANRTRAYLNDVVNQVKHLYFGKRSGIDWFAETYPGSNVPFTNSTPFCLLLSVQGGAVTAVRLNGLPVGTTGGLFPLKPGDSLTCTSGSPPSTYSSLLSDF